MILVSMTSAPLSRRSQLSARTHLTQGAILNPTALLSSRALRSIHLGSALAVAGVGLSIESVSAHHGMETRVRLSNSSIGLVRTFAALGMRSCLMKVIIILHRLMARSHRGSAAEYPHSVVVPPRLAPVHHRPHLGVEIFASIPPPTVLLEKTWPQIPSRQSIRCGRSTIYPSSA